MGYASWSVVFGEQPSAAKWNILGTNDSSFNDGSGIGSAAIKPNHLIASASTLNTHVWDSWTPTWTNITISSSSVVANYIQIGKTVHYRLKVVSAGAFAVTGNPGAFSLPVATNAAIVSSDIIGHSFYLDSSAGAFFFGHVWRGTTTSLGRLIAYKSDATYVTASDITNLIPMTWATPDEIHAVGTYEAA